MTFRYAYFGGVFPQPVVAKIGDQGLIQRVAEGGQYVLRSIYEYPLLIAIVPVGIVFVRAYFSTGVWIDRFALLALPVSYVVFIVSSGGDWMEGGRFFVPCIPVLVVIGQCLIVRLERRRMSVAAALAVNIILAVVFVGRDSMGIPMWDRRHLIDAASSDRNVFEAESVFETTNRVHLRDSIFLLKAGPIIRFYENHLPVPLELLSIQAGMVAFHLFESDFERLRFVDALGLSSRDFSSCALSRNWPRNSFGVEFSYEKYLPRKQEFFTLCHIPEPDIIFDLDDEKGSRAVYLKAHGYVIAYEQAGTLEGRFPFKGGYVICREFLAVRESLYRAFPVPTVSVKFGEIRSG